MRNDKNVCRSVTIHLRDLTPKMMSLRCQLISDQALLFSLPSFTDKDCGKDLEKIRFFKLVSSIRTFCWKSLEANAHFSLLSLTGSFLFL
jgi:hypothetical protein